MLRRQIFICLFSLLSIATQAQVAVVSGHLRGSDGHPLSHAHLSVYKFGSTTPDTVVAVSEAGGYMLAVSQKGAYRLEYSGLNHEPLSIPLFADHVIKQQVDVQLAATTKPNRIDSVLLLGSFNNYNRQSGVKMDFRKGTYQADVPSSNTEEAWQVLICYNGMSSEHGLIACAPGNVELRHGHYAQIQNTYRQKTVSFDPSVLRSTATKASVKADDKHFQHQAAVYEDLLLWKKSYDDSMDVAMTRWVSTGGDRAQFNLGDFRDRMRVSQREEDLRSKIKDEDDSVAERLLSIAYLSIPSEKRDQAMMEKALRIIGPASDMWAIDIQLLYVALNARQRETKDQYINDILATNRNENVAAPVAYSALIQASVLQDKQRQRELYAVLMDRFPKHPLAQAARYYLNPDRVIQVGHTIPSFNYTIGTKDKKHSEQSLKGNYTLIDLQTDHCPDCVAGIQNVLKITQGTKVNSKDKTLHIMALSMDKSAPQLPENAISAGVVSGVVQHDEAHPASKTFEYVGYPWRILIGPDLSILACGADLRDEHLATTLRMALP